MQVVDFVLAGTRGLALLKFSLRKRMGRNAARSRGKSTVELDGAAETFVTGTHESRRQISHMCRVGWIVGLPNWRGRNGGQETVTETAKL